MKRSTRLLRKLLATFLVVLMSINTFAAVVGDNDGAAFITKAEFDSIKSDFQTQIDKYSTRIDNKIDGTIAGYIEGIKFSALPMLYHSNCRAAIGRNPFFRNSVPGQGSSTWTTAINVSKQKGYSTQYILGKKLNRFSCAIQMHGNAWRAFILFTDWSQTLLKLPDTEYINKEITDGWAGMMVVDTYEDSLNFYEHHNGDYGPIEFNSYPITWTLPTKNYLNWTDEANGQWALAFKKDKVVSLEWTGVGWTGSEPENKLTGSQTRPQTTYFVHNVAKVDSASRAGSGSCWQYRTTPWNTRVLQRYYTSWWPVQSLVLDYKTYMVGPGVLTEGSVAVNALPDTQTCTYTPSLTAAYGTQTVGTRYSTPTTNNLVGYCQQNVVLNKASTDTNQYEIAQWGKLPVTNLYCAVSEPTLSKSSTNLASSYTNLAAGSVIIEGVSHTVTGVTNNVYEITGTPENLALDSFEVNPYTGVAGETVYVGGGMPFAYTQTANSETTFKITFRTLNLSDSVSGSTPVKWMLSTKQFKDGNYANTSDKLVEGTVTTNSSGIATITTTLDNLPNHQLIWLNAYSTTNDRIVEVTDCSATVR